VSGLLYRLSNLRAEKIVTEAATAAQLEQAGLTAPEVALELGGPTDTVLGALRFARGADGDWLVTGGAGQRIDIVEAGMVDDLSVSAADYEEKPLDADADAPGGPP
jgi:hypothetical protein